MSISTTTSRISYAGNGVTTVFAFPYYFLANVDLVVFQRVEATGVETVKALTTDYTVTGATVSTGGNVTMLVAPPTGTSLVIYRDPALTQDLSLVENDTFPSREMMRALDRAVLICQRLSNRLDRTVQLSSAYTSAFDTSLPTTIGSNPGATVQVNAAGNGLEIGPTSDAIAAAQTNATAAAASAVAASSSASSASTSAASAASALASLTTVPPDRGGTGVANNAAATTTRVGNFAKTETLTAITSVTFPISGTLATLAGAETLTNKNIAHNLAAKTANYTITSTDDVVTGNTTSAGFTLTLPSAASNSGKIYFIKKTDSSANVLTVSRAGSDLIDGATTTTLTIQYESIMLISDGGTNWLIF